MQIAIITGASSGMGKDFVKQLDKQFDYDEIWVIARRKERLLELQNEVKAKLVPLALDLTDKESINVVKQKLESEKPTVKTLVNASGFGRFGAFCDISLEEQYEMIDLNQKALIGMTYVTLPFMAEGSEIYQVDSLSSFQPVPYINVYGATKAFVLSFSRSLNVELKKRKIRVLAVCPGWVKTEFFDRAVTDETITYYNKFWNSEDVVKLALNDMRKGRDVSIMGLRTRIQVFFTKLLPHRLVMYIWCRQQKKL